MHSSSKNSLPSARLHHATVLFTKYLSIAEVTSNVTKTLEDDLSKQQKVFFLRQQRAAIDRELSRLSSPASDPSGPSDLEGNAEQDDQSELADLKKQVQSLAQGSEERGMAVREFRRLKRIPPSSVEHGVVRNYLEWLTSLPWPRAEDGASLGGDLTDPAFLQRARDQLDADHYGLDNVKRRLVEYLAVVRLKAVEAQREQEAAVEGQKRQSGEGKEDAQKADELSPRKAIQRVTNKGPILLVS